VERKESAPRSEPEKTSGGWRPTKRQTLWGVGMVVALLASAMLIFDLYPGTWGSLLERRNLMFVALVVSLTVIIVLLAVGGAASSWTGFQGKTLWDLLELLIVPLVLVTIGFVFSIQQDARQTAIENQRAEQARKLADRQAEEERKIADRRTEQATLQTYLDQIGTLLLDRNLREADEDSDVRRLARGRTLVVFDAVSSFRQVRALRFLYEAGLIQAAPGEQPVISLDNTSLPGIQLPGRHFLSGAHLHQANLSGADLDHADLGHTDLAGAELRYTDLERANLEGANLEGAYLKGARLSEAVLVDANLSSAENNRSNRGVDLSHADLSDANLTGATLSGADLSDANLEGATVTNEQLDGCETLQGATMPNGTKHH
jgi:uncharacterized protein YjbI with pentapeptide repeats